VWWNSVVSEIMSASVLEYKNEAPRFVWTVGKYLPTAGSSEETAVSTLGHVLVRVSKCSWPLRVACLGIWGYLHERAAVSVSIWRVTAGFALWVRPRSARGTPTVSSRYADGQLTSRYAHGQLTVCPRSARGTLTDSSQYSHGQLAVRSRSARDTLTASSLASS